MANTAGISLSGPDLTTRSRPPFAGQRVYTLGLRGLDKLILRILCYVAAAMPVPTAVIVWYTLLRDGGAAAPGTGRLLVILAAMLIWSWVTVWVVRSLVRRRSRTTVTLTAEGVRYRAPKVGLFAEWATFIRWEHMEKIQSGNRHNPSLVIVGSLTESFVFDRRSAREVKLDGNQRTYVPVTSGNDLLHDLVTYSGQARRSA